MFLFSRKTRTPISTYTDSYRAPNSIKKVYNDPPLWAWEPNKFVSRGPPKTFQRPVDQEALEKMVKCAVRDYTYKSSIPGHPYLPEKYWLSQKEEREVVVNMLNSLSRYQTLPQITPRCGCVDPLPGRLPFQGYESPCSGRHYCLRGIDYCVAGAPCTERRLQPLCPSQPTVRSVSPSEHRPGMHCAVITPLRPYYPYANLRWDTSHFKKTGGSQRNSYVVHPEFLSENYPGYSY
ncbi:Hypothetical protein D623_10010331 [Myotis brandtii]|uniref:Spermatid-specific manchette-related protein 1 n=1 Tax=Myotis brandtii TaxID=109478 RepID=S7MJH9_MYOBR|nr:Hypothetical protein D623_10010331 [Myotis brandtii]